MTIETAGYITVAIESTSGAIMSTGTTKETAIAKAVEDTGADYDDFEALPASASLIQMIEDYGGIGISMREIQGVYITEAEAEALEDE